MKRLIIIIIPILLVATMLIPHTYSQDISTVFSPFDYSPFGYTANATATGSNTPGNVTLDIVDRGETRVFEWIFYWTHDGPSQCSFGPIGWNGQTFGCVGDIEPVYVYANLISQNLIAVAYRFHFQWNVVYSPDSVAASESVIYPFNTTRPIITFVTDYHTPLTGYPNSTNIKNIIIGNTAGLSGSFSYTHNDYDWASPTSLDVISAAQLIDPFSLLGYNYPLIDTLTIFFVIGHWIVIGAFLVLRRRG